MSNEVVQQKLGYNFDNPALLELALTHSSYASNHNERLEFLGDALLNCVIAHKLFSTFPDLPEGKLSRTRANLVNQDALANLAQALELGKAIRLGDGEIKSGGSARPSILANTLEAVFAAVFLDGGFDSVSQVIHRIYTPLLMQIDPVVSAKDPKTSLQEFLQARKIAPPVYKIVATTGQAHQQHFEVECSVPQAQISSHGSGSSRRAAEQNAAKLAYQELLARGV
jgi:ribonuclease III